MKSQVFETAKLIRRLRTLLVGRGQDFTFRRFDPDSFRLPESDSTHLYIHIPFCKSLCPYCPYNRARYQRDQIAPYFEALKQEIGLYARQAGRLAIGSVYIGGGTPTNAIGELAGITALLKQHFMLEGEIAIETTVADINSTCVEQMKAAGITMVSLGVQSFSADQLKLLGRNYRPGEIEPAIRLLQQAGFKSLNVDLMFALPGQSDESFLADLQQLVALGVEQVTAYPLFTFPYTTVGTYQQISQVRKPGWRTRRRQYRLMHDYLSGQGYQRVSVWGFRKGVAPRYSSVTRTQYIGLGAGAASRYENAFYFNSFSIGAYQQALAAGKLPLAISMPIGRRLSAWYWFYWKLYDSHFSLQEVRQVFGARSLIPAFTRILAFFGLCRIKNRNEVSLTESGSFWIHLLQNYFVLDYINKVWTAMKKEAYPGEIRI